MVAREAESTGTEALGKPVTRRRMLTALGGAGIAAGVVACKTSPSSSSSSRSTPITSKAGSAPYGSGSAGQPDEPGSLRIPALLAPRTDTQGRKVFDLTAQAGTSTFLPGTTTQTWGFNGAYLGPTLRIARGDRVLLHVHNQLSAMTTMHSHGMRLPAIDDGGPHQMIPPGATWSPSWMIDQPAATLWYHPHPDGQTADQVYLGLAGMSIIDDRDSVALTLPDTYGVNDIPVIIQDKNLNADGSLNFAVNSSHSFDLGRLGQTILINGTYSPHLTIGDQRVRFRLLNASDARIYNVGFADGRTFDLIATDAGLVEHPVPLQRIQLAPAERAEIVATFEPGERIMLHSFAPDLGLSGVPDGGTGGKEANEANGFGEAGFSESRLNGGGQSFDLLQISAAGTLRPSPALPTRLATIPVPDIAKAVRTRAFQLDRADAVNGMRMSMTRVDAVVLADSTEIWEVDGFVPHDFHIHGVGFRVIDYAGGPPPPQIDGWKDTVYIPPFQTVRLLVPFGNYTDPHHPYMYHCHIMQHEDAGMMGQFVVIRPGQESQVSVGPAYDGTT
jgi:FtsP/CotA-like multicopper oxidase with cupredoxin domain